LMPCRRPSPHPRRPYPLSPIFLPLTSLSFWQILVPWFSASVATPRD
jgi:hypothetical protein